MIEIKPLQFEGNFEFKIVPPKNPDENSIHTVAFKIDMDNINYLLNLGSQSLLNQLGAKLSVDFVEFHSNPRKPHS